MKKHFIVLLLLSILFLLSSCVGTYFVNYALKRQEINLDKLAIEDVEVSSLDKISKIEENKDFLKSNKESFLKTVKPQRWNYTSSDGLKLIGDFYEKEGSHRYVLLVHGYLSKKEDMLMFAPFFYDWGFNVLATDNRGHGESEGQWVGMGLPDSYDQLGWINKIIQSDPLAQITMLGISMGGATVMMTSGLVLPSNVKCLIEDCGYSSTYDVFAGQLKSIFNLPPEPVLTWADKASVRKAGYSIKEASSIERLKKATVPMLFIHGTGDTFVPYSMLDENIEAYNGPFYEVLRVSEATHAEAISTDTQTYLKTVHDFVFKFID